MNLGILDIYNDLGTVHDFKMFKESMIGVLPEDIVALLDSEYQGVCEYFPNVVVPFKGSKRKPLTEEERLFDTRLSKSRVVIEHISRELKIYRICKETYRGKGQRGLVRVKNVASLYNHRCKF